MGARDEFLRWVDTRLVEAETALHNGDHAPRRALWSHRDPVSVLGAWRTAHGQGEPRSYTLRATQVYRREDGEWKVVHRHADTVTD